MRRPPTLPPMPKREILATEPVLPSTPELDAVSVSTANLPDAEPHVEPCDHPLEWVRIMRDGSQLCACGAHRAFGEEPWTAPTPEVLPHELPSMPVPAELCPLHNASECYCAPRPGEVWETENVQVIPPPHVVGPGPTSTPGAASGWREEVAWLSARVRHLETQVAALIADLEDRIAALRGERS